jgi:hypothetical protein
MKTIGQDIRPWSYSEPQIRLVFPRQYIVIKFANMYSEIKVFAIASVDEADVKGCQDFSAQPGLLPSVDDDYSLASSAAHAC